ncbi:MAG TPA: type II toxin-antitoxin system RelE/ParE family toxin [Vicinamibacteria bacterium]|nr:type II toxin-antitoxin system RelE/ParE family toxin [Vicinamibacteria bacterium]
MQILYLHEFIEELERLDNDVQKQVRNKLKELFRTPFGQLAPLPLKGAQFKGLYKLRVGDWRLIYKVQQDELIFITLGHRSEVYRK